AVGDYRRREHLEIQDAELERRDRHHPRCGIHVDDSAEGHIEVDLDVSVDNVPGCVVELRLYEGSADQIAEEIQIADVPCGKEQARRSDINLAVVHQEEVEVEAAFVFDPDIHRPVPNSLA